MSEDHVLFRHNGATHEIPRGYAVVYNPRRRDFDVEYGGRVYTLPAKGIAVVPDSAAAIACGPDNVGEGLLSKEGVRILPIAEARYSALAKEAGMGLEEYTLRLKNDRLDEADAIAEEINRAEAEAEESA